MYDDILVPTDGSDAVEGAVEHALELAETYGARVHALYVVPPLYTLEGSFEQVYSAMEEEGEEAVDAIAHRAQTAGLRTRTSIRQGEPHRQILKYAREHGVDLVVMGTHGRTGLDRYLVGSVTEKVVRKSEVPVLTIRHRGEGTGDEGAAESDPEAVDDLADEAPDEGGPTDPDGGL